MFGERLVTTTIFKRKIQKFEKFKRACFLVFVLIFSLIFWIGFCDTLWFNFSFHLTQELHSYSIFSKDLCKGRDIWKREFVVFWLLRDNLYLSFVKLGTPVCWVLQWLCNCLCDSEVARILLGKAGSRAGCSNLDNISLCLRLVYFLALFTLLYLLLFLLIIIIVILTCLHSSWFLFGDCCSFNF